jgi:hypothetical protein
MAINIKGHDVLINEEDFELISQHNWGISQDQRYFRVRTGDHIYLMHRMIMNCKKGDKKVVDHINGNTWDNRKSNLRICNDSKNLMNRGKTKKNTSGYKGVSWSGYHKKWASMLWAGDKKYFLGYYNCPTAAWFAYVRGAVKYHGEFAKFN